MNQKIIFVILTAVLTAGAMFQFNTNTSVKTNQVSMLTAQKFQLWKNSVNKVYSSPEEEKYRLSVFAETMSDIERRNNLPGQTATFAINEFSDMTDEEFITKYGSKTREEVDFSELNNSSMFQKKVGVDNLPEEIDWRTRGIITPVYNQGVCGAGYAFAVTDALAAVHAIDKLDLWALSPQEIIDCSVSYGSHGCSGGRMIASYNYVNDHGVQRTSTYPYVARLDTCKRSSSTFRYKPDEYKTVPINDNEALQQAVNYVPVSVGIDASSLKSYSRGIISQNCGQNLNHDMLIMGYGTYTTEASNTSTDFWLLKNSWGTRWGEEGYIKVKRTPGVAPAICGVSKSAIFPWVIYVD
jgi:C1A family cysteine protease